MFNKLTATFFAFALIIFTGCKSTSSYTNKTGMSMQNTGYSGSGGETQMVEADGMAAITQAGEQNAYERALEHAMRKAVEKVLGSMISSTTEVENSVLKKDQIISKSAGFVQKYEVLEELNDGKTKRVRIKAWVVLGDVKDDAIALGLLQDRVGRPMLMTLIEEVDMNGMPTQDSKNAVQRVFIDSQFPLVDEEQIKKVLAARNIQVSKISGVSSTDLAKVAVDAGAQVLIKGTVSSSEQEITHFQGTGMKSVRSTVNLEVLYAADGRIIASESSVAPGARPSVIAAEQLAVKQASEKAAEKLIDKVLKAWDDMSNNGFEYDVVITGVSFSEIKQITQSLSRNVEGVKKVIEKGFANGTATLLVRYSGLSSDLAGHMLDPGFNKFGLDMKKYDSKSILLFK